MSVLAPPSEGGPLTRRSRRALLLLLLPLAAPSESQAQHRVEERAGERGGDLGRVVARAGGALGRYGGGGLGVVPSFLGVAQLLVPRRREQHPDPVRRRHDPQPDDFFFLGGEACILLLRISVRRGVPRRVRRRNERAPDLLVRRHVVPVEGPVAVDQRELVPKVAVRRDDGPAASVGEPDQAPPAAGRRGGRLPSVGLEEPAAGQDAYASGGPGVGSRGGRGAGRWGGRSGGRRGAADHGVGPGERGHFVSSGTPPPSLLTGTRAVYQLGYLRRIREQSRSQFSCNSSKLKLCKKSLT